ncbi:MAG: RNA methyltransferase [Thermoanaerobaculia bacterium]
MKTIRALRRSKGDHALLEGPHLLGEAIAAGIALDSILVTPEYQDSPAGARLLSGLARPAVIVAPRILAALSDSDSPRGVLAVATLARRGAASLPLAGDGIWLFLDGVQDPGNLGAIARVAEAFGVTGLALAPGSAHPNHSRALRASAGSLLRLPVAVEVSVADLDDRLAPAAPQWAVLSAHGGQPLAQADLEPPLVLALGAEGPGVSPTVERRADLAWTIPLAAGVESLNVGVAAGIVLFELRRRRASRSPRD